MFEVQTLKLKRGSVFHQAIDPKYTSKSTMNKAHHCRFELISPKKGQFGFLIVLLLICLSGIMKYITDLGLLTIVFVRMIGPCVWGLGMVSKCVEFLVVVCAFGKEKKLAEKIQSYGSECNFLPCNIGSKCQSTLHFGVGITRYN